MQHYKKPMATKCLIIGVLWSFFQYASSSPAGTSPNMDSPSTYSHVCNPVAACKTQNVNITTVSMIYAIIAVRLFRSTSVITFSSIILPRSTVFSVCFSLEFIVNINFIVLYGYSFRKAVWTLKFA